MAFLAPSGVDLATLGSRRVSLAHRRGRLGDVTHAVRPRRRRGPSTLTITTVPRAFLGNDAEKDPFKRHRLRDPVPFPQSIGVGFQCALVGAKTAVTNPSDVCGPMTGATLSIEASS